MTRSAPGFPHIGPVRPPRLDQRIRDDIAAGRIELGARLTMEELAARYGVSHMPVREALRELHGNGLVRMERGRGARVISVDREFVDDLFETRGAIETILARRAARRIQQASLDTLHDVEKERQALVAAGDFPGALAANRRFHEEINKVAASRQASVIVDQHWVLIAALWRRYGYAEERFAGVSSDHLNLLRALASRDPHSAGIIMAAHVVKAKYDLLAAMPDHDDDGKGSGRRRR